MHRFCLYMMYHPNGDAPSSCRKSVRIYTLNHEEAAKHKDHMLEVYYLPYGFSVYVDDALLMVSPYAFLLMVLACVLKLFCVRT